MSHYAKWRETPRLEASLKAAGWLGGFGSANHLHSSVIGFLGLLISLSDLATGLLDPILVLGGSVVLVISLLTRALPKVSAGVHQSFMPDRPDCRRRCWPWCRPGPWLRCRRWSGRTGTCRSAGWRASRSAASELRWSRGKPRTERRPRVLGVRVVSSGLGGGEGLHLLLLAVHGEGRQRGGGVVVTQGLLHVLSGPGTGEQHVGGASLMAARPEAPSSLEKFGLATTSTR